ncbi:MAG TPA: hypothetical protein VHU89_14725 [Acidobacteriaceae bacterium]|nr:hypothetical protein [Acidobacteriaceae bacterium]
MATLIFGGASARAQNASGPQNAMPLRPSTVYHPAAPSAAERSTYRELDLLRRDGFAGATQATVTVRVVDKKGNTAGDLRPDDFALIVNGTRRAFRLHVPIAGAPTVPPIVLLVFPPNQPLVHHMGAEQAIRYFSRQAKEQLSWKVGTFDANGKFAPFTDSRSALLARLNEIDRTKEPFEYAGDGMPGNIRMESGWLTQADETIGLMQRYAGPKLILAMNPSADWSFGLNDPSMAQDGPEALMSAAGFVGGHIFVDDVSGPGVVIPGGEAADTAATWGTVPSYHAQVSPRQMAQLNYFAYRTSQMMQAGEDTQGGFANSLDKLAAQMNREVTGNYLLDFDLTAEDRDRGAPDVSVQLARRPLRLNILDVVPIGVEPGSAEAGTGRRLALLLREATAGHVRSPEFRIFQHVDHFPVHEGLKPDLPMGGAVAWTGAGPAPAEIQIVDSVEDANFSTVLLQREMTAHWDGRSFAWEHDGQLEPGEYIWRTGVYDGRGTILAAAEEKIDVEFPHASALAMSSLVFGRSCETGPSASGLQRRPAPGTGPEGPHPVIDPMRAMHCRIKLDATDSLLPSDRLLAFVRIYPDDKLGRRDPGQWRATYRLQSASGAVETQREIPFTLDSGSGYVAFAQMPLEEIAGAAGRHTLEVVVRGPGIRGELKEMRSIFIGARGPESSAQAQATPVVRVQ